MNNALNKISKSTINTPNDLLGLSYIKEIIKNKYDIEPITIKRTNDYNSKILNDDISSATSIREALNNNKDISRFVPKETINLIKKYDENKYFELLKYKIISDKDLSIYQTVDEGIDNKIIKEINNSNNIEELINNVKSKRYTYNKITRMFNHILCSYTKEENNKNNDINYIKVLGFSNKGKNYLNKIKKETSLPIITNINKNNINLLELEIRVDSIYNLIMNINENIYNKKPIIKDIAK